MSTNHSFPKSRTLDFCLNAVSNDYTHLTFRQEGSLDSRIASWLVDNVKPGWIVYDIGSNIFEYSEIAARLSGPNGIVHSFEPQKKLIDEYLAVKPFNDYSNVSPIVIYDFGLSNENKQVEFWTMPNNTGASTICKNFVEVFSDYVYDYNGYIEVKRADSLELPDDIPDLIKLDIEGAESLFWLGAPDFLKQAKNILIEVGSYTEDWFLDELLKDRKPFWPHGNKEFDLRLLKRKSNKTTQFDVVFSKI